VGDYLLWPSMAIKGSLQNACWKYHLILCWVVVGINCWWSHTPSVREERKARKKNNDLTVHWHTLKIDIGVILIKLFICTQREIQERKTQ